MLGQWRCPPLAVAAGSSERYLAIARQGTDSRFASTGSKGKAGKTLSRTDLHPGVVPSLFQYFSWRKRWPRTANLIPTIRMRKPLVISGAPPLAITPRIPNQHGGKELRHLLPDPPLWEPTTRPTGQIALARDPTCITGRLRREFECAESAVRRLVTPNPNAARLSLWHEAYDHLPTQVSSAPFCGSGPDSHRALHARPRAVHAVHVLGMTGSPA